MDTTDGSDRLRLAGYVLVAIALVTATGAGTVDLPLALVPLAVLLGWSHLHSV